MFYAAGGHSKSNQDILDGTSGNNDYEDALTANIGGYGKDLPFFKFSNLFIMFSQVLHHFVSSWLLFWPLPPQFTFHP
jgi:hypothetical protein